jgi:GTPase SAR1 family protein
LYGQVVVGPPGSGKTVYCHGLQQFFSSVGRPCAVVNLDPANETARYRCDADVKDLVDLERVQDELGLGPNGGLMFAMEYLEKNMDWLEEKIRLLACKDASNNGEPPYFVFDLPGQVELTTCHDGLLRVLNVLTGKLGMRLTAVHIVDCHLCTEPAKYLSALVLSLSTMLYLGLPHVNVLSKVDMLEQFGELEFQPQFFLNPMNLEYLAESVQESMDPKFAKATQSLCEILQDFGMITFAPLAVEDAESMAYVVRLADKANGYALSGNKTSTMTGVMNVLDTEDPEDIWARIQQRTGGKNTQS